jgi:lipid-binding SYLF domain-containing protein
LYSKRRSVLAVMPAAAGCRGLINAIDSSGTITEGSTRIGARRDASQADPNLTWFREHDHEAIGFLIASQVVKAGFVFGGSGGRAVLVAKGDKGWAGPAFYTMGTASVGFQAGVNVSEVVTLVMNKKALESLMSGSVKAGADASVAAGPVGVGAGTRPNADFLVFSRAKGLYGGVDVNGAVIKPTEDWNKAYYGRLVSPIDIVIRGQFHKKGADALLEAVEKAVTPAKK